MFKEQTHWEVVSNNQDNYIGIDFANGDENIMVNVFNLKGILDQLFKGKIVLSLIKIQLMEGQVVPQAPGRPISKFII